MSYAEEFMKDLLSQYLVFDENFLTEYIEPKACVATRYESKDGDLTPPKTRMEYHTFLLQNHMRNSIVTTTSEETLKSLREGYKFYALQLLEQSKIYKDIMIFLNDQVNYRMRIHCYKRFRAGADGIMLVYSVFIYKRIT